MSADRWRLFLALPAPDAVARSLHEQLGALRNAYAGTRWMPAEQYHVTLRFLGSIPADRVDAVHGALQAAAAAAVPFELEVAGAGGMQGRSDAVWLEVGRGAQHVAALADATDALLPADVLGSPPRARPRPHLTVARRGSMELVAALRSGDPAHVHAMWQADRGVLYRSFTGTPAGSRYESLAEVALGASVLTGGADR